MGSKKFWVLQPPFNDGRKEAEWQYGRNERIWMDVRKCPLNPEHFPSIREAPLKVKLKGGKQDAFIWTVHSNCLLQENAKGLLTSHGLTGGFLSAIESAHYRGKPFDGPLYELKVSYGGNAVTDALKLQERCSGCGRERYTGDGEGFEVDTKSSNGYDFFFVWPLPNYIVVSDKAAKVLLNSGLDGFSVVPTEFFRFSGEYTPGNLERWLCPESFRK